MSRSKCVVCGKKRERVFLTKLFDKTVCSRSITFNGYKTVMSLTKPHSFSYVHPCFDSLLKIHKDTIDFMIDLYNVEILNHKKDNIYPLLSELKCPFRSDKNCLEKLTKS